MLDALKALQSDIKPKTDKMQTRNETNQSPLVPRIIAGSVGAIITALAVTPLEVVKVRQQAALDIPSPQSLAKTGPYVGGNAKTSATIASMKKCPDCGIFILNNGLMECVVPKKSVPYFQSILSSCTTQSRNTSLSVSPKEHTYGTFRLLHSIFKKEGLSGIYAGLSPTLVMSVPNTVLYFTAYDELNLRMRQFSRQWVPRSEDNSNSHILFDSVLTPLVGGSTARIIATVVTSPLELIKTRQASRMASSSLPTKGNPTTISSVQSQTLFQELGSIIRVGGVTSLYKGLAPTLYRDVPFSAIYWLFLEQFKSILKERSLLHAQPSSPLVASSHAFVSGAMAGMIAAFCTTPFDVVKTRQQMDMMQQVAATDSMNIELTREKKAICDHRLPNRGVVRGGTWVQLREIASTEGLTGLWRGNQTRMIKVAPACAIMISSYEFGKRILVVN